MNKQKGVIHLVVPLLLLIIAVASLFVLSSLKVIKLPNFFNKMPLIGSKQPSVELKQTYQNPFKKETQYKNPFQEYKNPFLNR